MPKYDHFEDLPVWQEAARLYNAVLDLLGQHKPPLGFGFRNQLDRAALSVSNNIAEGFDRVTTSELIAFLGYARGSAGEVRSMIAVVQNRPELKPIENQLKQVRTLAESCSRQLMAWTRSVEESRVKGKRHLSGERKRKREVERKAKDFRIQFLRNLKPDHPLYNSSEARQPRGEGDHS